VREFDPAGAMVFVTSHPEFLYLTLRYKVGVMDFLKKGDFEKLSPSIHECIATAYERSRGAEAAPKRMFRAVTGIQEYLVPYDEIIYFTYDSIDRMVEMVTRTSKKKISGTLEELEQLAPNFYRCHKSFIINIDKIEKINKAKKEAHLVGGHVCIIAYRKLKGLLDLL
jgi:two-component system response regulator AgrA